MVNIFLLDDDLALSAKYTYDLHIVKGILEAVQIFFSVRKLLKFNEKNIGYKAYRLRFAYSGCVIWAMKSYENYMFLVNFTKYLNNEFKYRQNVHDDHASYKHMCSALKCDDDDVHEKFAYTYFTEICQCMPFLYQHNNHVIAYRRYYFFHKRLYLPSISWKRRRVPYWHCEEYFYENNIYVET